MNFRPWLSFGLLFALSACGRNAGDVPPTIVVSGDTDGWIVPCGCTSNQSGGMPRRGTFVEECRRKGPVIVVDAGGAAHGVSTYDRLKFEAIVKGELAMGIAAHNIGRAEIELGPECLARLQQDLKMPFISANAADAEGRPLAEPMRIVEAGGRRVMFVGVLDPKYESEKVRIAPPRQAISKTMQKAAGKFDQVVVLAYLPEENLHELADNLPEVDAIVGGPTGQPVPPANPRGFLLLTSATRQGKFMAKLTWPDGSKNSPLRGELVELDSRFADEPRQTNNVKEFYAEMKRRDLSPKDTSFLGELPPGGRTTNSIAGSNACKSCHEEDCRTWKKSKHAEAWNSLVEKDAQFNPDCQRCHVTGYGQAGGFSTVAASSKRVGVGCESCHGMSQTHCKTTTTATQFAKQSKDRCRDCHDRENSPKFDYDAYWAKIVHGQPANSSEENTKNEEE